MQQAVLPSRLGLANVHCELFHIRRKYCATVRLTNGSGAYLRYFYLGTAGTFHVKAHPFIHHLFDRAILLTGVIPKPPSPTLPVAGNIR